MFLMLHHVSDQNLLLLYLKKKDITSAVGTTVGKVERFKPVPQSDPVFVYLG